MADGFYEWAKEGDGKQPYRITLKDGAPFTMAGLWESWRRGEQRIESFTIIVTSANELSRRIHDRMPVILHPDTWDVWLTAKDATTPLVRRAPHVRYPDRGGPLRTGQLGGRDAN